MTEINKIVDMVEKKAAAGKTVCTAKLVELCKKKGIKIPEVYGELNKKNLMQHLK